MQNNKKKKLSNTDKEIKNSIETLGIKIPFEKIDGQTYLLGYQQVQIELAHKQLYLVAENEEGGKFTLKDFILLRQDEIQQKMNDFAIREGLDLDQMT